MHDGNHIPGLGKIKRRDTYAFYDQPLIFSAVNVVGDLFLISLADEDLWMAVRITEGRLAAVDAGQIDLRSAFAEPECGEVIFADYANGTPPQVSYKLRGDPTLEQYLAEPGTRLKDDGEAPGTARPDGPTGSFQPRVHSWVLACFGEEIALDKVERHHRFFEEATELVQATGCSCSEAHQLVDYVYGRPVGETRQEVGGVMITLAALCTSHRIDMQHEGEVELDRIWGKVEVIRLKQASKPKGSPLPS